MGHDADPVRRVDITKISVIIYAWYNVLVFVANGSTLRKSLEV